MTYKLSYENLEENCAYAVGRSLGISTKKSVEVCNLIRGTTTEKAKNMLNKVILMQMPVPYTRFNKDTGHKKGIGPGRYPIKTVKEILKIIESAEGNAQNKGLSTHNLKIVHISAHSASRPWHQGRQRRRKMKRASIEVVVKEQKEEKDKK
ncbi:MAG: 50S ribosomal protein L22 [Nanoarchaeota archaeon]|nr:50S ribosomal protein L22 [Nanoarchaeota archaeon]